MNRQAACRVRGGRAGRDSAADAAGRGAGEGADPVKRVACVEPLSREGCDALGSETTDKAIDKREKVKGCKVVRRNLPYPESVFFSMPRTSDRRRPLTATDDLSITT